MKINLNKAISLLLVLALLFGTFVQPVMASSTKGNKQHNQPEIKAEHNTEEVTQNAKIYDVAALSGLKQLLEITTSSDIVIDSAEIEDVLNNYIDEEIENMKESDDDDRGKGKSKDDAKAKGNSKEKKQCGSKNKNNHNHIDILIKDYEAAIESEYIYGIFLKSTKLLDIKSKLIAYLHKLSMSRKLSTDDLLLISDIRNNICLSNKIVCNNGIIALTYITNSAENKATKKTLEAKLKSAIKHYQKATDFINKELYVPASVSYRNSYKEFTKAFQKAGYSLNAEFFDLDTDSDADKITDGCELLFGTNPFIKDTDGDKLDDYQELIILGTNPLKKDSDNNEILDPDEDCDLDGLSNIYEIINGTNPIAQDSDFDGLDDKLEIEYGTSPLIVDTDEDGLTDYEEYLLGTDPTDINSDGSEKETIEFNSKELGFYGHEVDATIQITATKQQLATFSLDSADEVLLNLNVPGYIGSDGYTLNMEGAFDSATLTMTFNEELLNDPSFVPAIYYYNEEFQLLEELENQIIDENSVSVALGHFSTYILLNKTEFDAVWDYEIKPPDTTNDGTPTTLDIAFVIDYSYSMTWNDPNSIRKDVTKSFINKLRNGLDRGSVISFISKATVLAPLTDDKDLMISAVDSIKDDNGYSQYAGTNGSDGLRAALDELSSTTADSIYIVFLTDGEDTSASYSYESLISEASSKGITIYTVGLGGANGGLLQEIAEGTGGKYYYATTVEENPGTLIDEVFEEIESETIDYEADSNNDGISDYYTKLMCEGKLVSGVGSHIFPGADYEQVQKNDDYDNDGLKNGEEVIVTMWNGKIYANYKSYPTRKYSDLDLYDDYSELKVHNTNPLKNNLVVSYVDINNLTTDTFYYANKYKESYENSALISTSVWLGNNVYGSEYDKVTMHKQALLELFTSISETTQEENETMAAIDMGLEYAGTMRDVLDQFMVELIRSVSSNADYVKNMEQSINHLKASIDDLITSQSKNPMAKDDFYRYLDDLNDQWKNLADKSDDLKSYAYNKFKISSKVSKVLKGVEIGLNIFEIGLSVKDAIDDYAVLSSNLYTIQENIYMLDIISSNTTDNTLKIASNELKEAVQSSYNAKADMVKQVIKNAAGTIIYIAVHELVGNIPAAGIWIEIGIGISNIILPVDDISKCCYQTYGIGCVTEVLSSDLFRNIEKNKQKNSVALMIYAPYNSAAVTISNKFMNLAASRVHGEQKMIEMQEMRPKWLNWVYNIISEDYEVIVQNCRDNINYLKSTQGKYKVYFD